MRVIHDEISQTRTAVLDDGSTCVHPYVDGEPAGYSAWHCWADTVARNKYRLVKCPTKGCPIRRLVDRAIGEVRS